MMIAAGAAVIAGGDKIARSGGVLMTIYPGVVKGNVVVLPSGISLSDGLVVQIQVPSESLTPTIEENRFKQSLVELGLLREIKTPSRTLTRAHPPIQIKGKPLSQSLIEERR
jgi:hypothetical protein